MEETSDLLRSWLKPPDIVKNFLDNDISIEKFKDLTDAYLRELCPHIGHRMTLKTHIHELLDSIAETGTTDTILDLTRNASTTSNLEDQNSSLPCVSDISNFIEGFNRLPLPEFDIKTLLQTSAHGNSNYNRFRVLNAKKRNILVDIVIKHVYTYIVNNKLTPEDYNLIAAKIVTLFPSENIASYYMKAISKSKSTSEKYIPAKGKLVDKVRNILYVSGVRHRRRQSTGNQEEEESSAQLDLALDDDVLWLNTHSDPWDEVVDKWIKTQPCRVNLNSTGIATVDEVLQKWTILRNPKGHVLIDLDFDQMFKEKSLNFHKNWQSFFTKLTSNLEIKNSTGLSLLETLELCVRCGQPLGEDCRCLSCHITMEPQETEHRDDPRWKFTRGAPRVLTKKTMADRFPPAHEFRRLLNAIVDDAVVESRRRFGDRQFVRREFTRALREKLEGELEARDLLDHVLDLATGVTMAPVRKRPDYGYVMRRIHVDALERTEPFPKSAAAIAELPSAIRARELAELLRRDPHCYCHEKKDKVKFTLDDMPETERKMLLPSEVRELEDMLRCKCDVPTPTPSTMQGGAATSQTDEENEDAGSSDDSNRTHLD